MSLLGDVSLKLGDLTPSETKVVRAVEELLRYDIFPGPVSLNRVLHHHRHRNINGRETRIRTACLQASGYRLVHLGKYSQRWYRAGGPNPHPVMELPSWKAVPVP